MGLLCDLQLDNCCGVYQPGDIISGRVVLTLEERNLIKALAIKIAGYTQIGWVKAKKVKKQKEKKSKKNDEIDVAATKTKEIVENYINREDYIATINYFMGSEAASPRLIDSGHYTYSFSVRLPDNSPPSFESEIGRISYELEVFIDFPDRRHTCMARTLKVNKPLDLRLESNLQQPAELDITEHVSKGKFWQKPLQLHVDIPQRGYVPGENISVHVKLLNPETLFLTNLTYKLNQVSLYTGTFKKKVRVKTESKSIQTHCHSLFGQLTTVIQHLQMLTVPSGLTPTLTAADCKCLQIDYEVEVVVTTNKSNRGIRVVLPVKVGTISLKSNLMVISKDVSCSTPILSAARSMEHLELNINDRNDDFSVNGYVPTAPVPDTPSVAASMNSLASSFREADFMATTHLNEKKKKHNMAGEKQEFKPKYLYYEMEGNPVRIVNEMPESSNSQTIQVTEVEKVPL